MESNSKYSKNYPNMSLDNKLKTNKQLYYIDKLRSVFLLNPSLLRNNGVVNTMKAKESLVFEHFIQSFNGLHYTANLPQVKPESLKKK